MPLISALLFLATAAQADCTCTFKGGDVIEGQTACIDSAKGKSKALCSKVQNVTSWVILDEPCDSRDVSEIDVPRLLVSVAPSASHE